MRFSRARGVEPRFAARTIGDSGVQRAVAISTSLIRQAENWARLQRFVIVLALT